MGEERIWRTTSEREAQQLCKEPELGIILKGYESCHSTLCVVSDNVVKGTEPKGHALGQLQSNFSAPLGFPRFCTFSEYY